MGDIIKIGRVKFERKHSRHVYGGGCPHEHLQYDFYTQTVKCEDCNENIAPFRAFLILLSQWRDGYQSLKRWEQELRELEAQCGGRLLRATRRVEKAWRSRKMVPTCPHCHKPIFPEDGFGGAAVNKKMAQQRRKFMRAKEEV